MAEKQPTPVCRLQRLNHLLGACHFYVAHYSCIGWQSSLGVRADTLCRIKDR
jgi:hypothetical protein